MAAPHANSSSSSSAAAPPRAAAAGDDRSAADDVCYDSAGNRVPNTPFWRALAAQHLEYKQNPEKAGADARAIRLQHPVVGGKADPEIDWEGFERGRFQYTQEHAEEMRDANARAMQLQRLMAQVQAAQQQQQQQQDP